MLDDLGLFAALRWYTDQQAQRAGLRIQFAAEPMEMRLDPALETACFRVAQEALTNIVRHAEARNVTVDLSMAERFLQLTIRDDGIGFNMKETREHVVAGSSLGLLYGGASFADRWPGSFFFCGAFVQFYVLLTSWMQVPV